MQEELVPVSQYYKRGCKGIHPIKFYNWSGYSFLAIYFLYGKILTHFSGGEYGYK
jgi:hypothetical protein